jgi:predicted O-methyltransferase YrrM
MPNITNEIRSILFKDQDIWLDRTSVDNGYPHTNLTEELIRWAISDKQNIFWLEIGSMVGGSAILSAEIAKKININIDIICLDPFTGDVNMWEWEQGLRDQSKWQFLCLKNGAPTIRQRFLANIFDSGFLDCITPIQTTGIVGIKLLKRLHINKKLSYLPNVIYVDSAHEIGETFLELRNAWDILEEGGALIGDDLNWRAVEADVHKFAKSINRPVNIFNNNQWGIRK